MGSEFIREESPAKDSSAGLEANRSLNDSQGQEDESLPIRVWWGYKRPDVNDKTFDEQLGNVFIPVTVQQMKPLGLESYLPAVLPTDKPAEVPDEIAIVFYKDIKSYQDSRATVYGREYQLLHRALFNFDDTKGLRSTSDFPVPFKQKLEDEKPYSLLPSKNVDWQSGTSKLFVGVPLSGQTKEQFRSSLSTAIQDIQRYPSVDLDAAIVRVSDKFVTYWEHYKNSNNASQNNIDALSKITKPVMRSDSASVVTVPLDGNTKFAGLPVKRDSFLNLQF